MRAVWNYNLEIETWREHEGFVHRVYTMDEGVVTMCTILKQAHRRYNAPRGFRRDDLSTADRQPVTCLWCIAGSWP